ncbi:MAG: hypothetical protein ACKO5A_08710 [Actinomycetota bacterium]
MRIPAVLRQPTLWLVLGPVLALVVIVAASRLTSGSAAEERVARASSTTTTTVESDSPPESGPDSTPDAAADTSAQSGATADVLGTQEDSGFSEGESLTGVGFDDGAATDELGASFSQLDLTAPPPSPDTPPTTTPPPGPAPTTVPPTTVPPTTAAPTTAPPTTAPPTIQVQSRTTTLQLSCTVVDQSAPNVPGTPVPATAVVGISTVTGTPTSSNLPVLVGLLGPPNLLGVAERGDHSQEVRLSAVGSGAPLLSLTKSNPLVLAPLQPVPIPDGRDEFLAGTFSVTSPPASSITIALDTVIFTRVAVPLLEERCVVAPGASGELATLSVVDQSTPTTSIALPPPVVSESPLTALLPISAFVVAGGALALLVRRRRIALTHRGATS